MTAILVLLALLFVAAVAAHRDWLGFAFHLASGPVLVGLGLLLSPRGLGFILPSTVTAMQPALIMAVAWLALLLGLRMHRPALSAEGWSDATFLVLAAGGTWLACAGGLWAVMTALSSVGYGVLGLERDMGSDLGVALVLGGVVCGSSMRLVHEATQPWPEGLVRRRLRFLARHDDLFAALAIGLAVVMLPSSVSVFETSIPSSQSVILVVGLLLALAYVVAVGLTAAVDGPARMALLGLCIMGAGVAAIARLPVVAVTFVFGFALAWAGVGGRLLEGPLARTERPVRWVVLALCGVTLELQWPALWLGLGLALSRLAAKAVVVRLLGHEAGERVPLHAALGSSGVTIPFVLALVMARPTDVHAGLLVTTVVVAVAATDLVALLLWPRKDMERLVEEPREMQPGEPCPPPTPEVPA